MACKRAWVIFVVPLTCLPVMVVLLHVRPCPTRALGACGWMHSGGANRNRVTDLAATATDQLLDHAP